MTGGSGCLGSSPRDRDGSSSNNSESSSPPPPPPHFNEYLAGSPFRGLARSASDVGLDNASSGTSRNGDGCARSEFAASSATCAANSPGDDADQYGDGSASRRRESAGMESAAAAVDESLLASPILADYVGDANGSGGSSGGSNGKKSKPRTSQSPRAAAAKASSLRDVAEESSANIRNNEADDEDNAVHTADLDNASLAASTNITAGAAAAAAAAAAPEPISLGAHLQLDTSMCPSLGLGSIGSDEGGDDENENDGDDDEDGSNRNIADFGAQLGGEPEIPDAIGAFEADVTCTADGDEDTSPLKSGLDVSQKEKTSKEEFNATEEVGPIQNKADGDNSPTDESTETIESSMDYSADSAAADSVEAPALMGENRQDEGDERLLVGQGVAAAGSTSTGILDEALDQHESNKIDSEQIVVPEPNSTPSNRESAETDSSFNDSSDQIVAKNGALRDIGDMGRNPLDAPAVDNPLKFSLSPIARNSSSSPLGLARSPKVDLDSCNVDNITKNKEAQILESDAQPATKEPRETASDEADQNPNDYDISAHSTTRVSQVVEAPVGKSNDALPTSADTDSSPTENSPNISTRNTQEPEKVDSNESTNEEAVFSRTNSTLRLLHATPPPCNMPSLKFGSPEGDSISPPQTEPEMYDSALAPSSAASNGISLNPLTSPTTGTPLASYDEPPESSPTVDLSSAKKKLGASSHALIERLRGAAQKRKLLVTRSRDSFVAKEQRQKLSLENAALSAQTEEEEEVYEPETPEPIKPIGQRRHFEGINPVREFKARPLPATTGDLGGGGQAGVPKVSKRSPTVPSSPLLGNRRRLKEGSVGESKAYRKVKEEERKRREMSQEARSRNASASNTVSKRSLQEHASLVPFKARPLPATTGDLGHGGQTGVPKVTKRTPTVPSSPLLGHRRPTGNSQPSRAYQAIAKKKEMLRTTSLTSVAKAKAAPSVKPSALRAQSFERLLSGSDASRAKENSLNEKRERQEAEAQRKSSFRARPLPATSGSVGSRNDSPELVGLDLLTSSQKGSGDNVPHSYPGEENETPSNETPPSAESPPKKQRIGSGLPERLHSTKRAKERAQYDELRLSCDRERQQREAKARNRIIQETKAELDELKYQI